MQTFVQGKCNRLAAASIMHLVDRPGEANPLFIYGPTGTGKSHLLEASVRDTLNRYPQRKCLYITAEQFTTHFLEALHGRGLPSFHRKIRSYELLAIDDIQFMAGKKVTLMELLSTMDYMLQHGRQLVLSADRPAHELTELSKEITTRLSGGLPLKLEAPDHATRIGIVRHFASKLSLELNDEIQEFISTHFSEHARELAGATHRLYAAWRMQKKPLTLACAEEALAEMIHRNTRGVKLQDIEEAVCKIVGLNPDSLKSDERRKVINTTRMLAMWLARKHTRAALSEIGTYFGRRSHSTVISAQKTVTSWVNEQSQVSLGNRTWNIEEAIRKVEAQLRASG
jgi:chromosomal replication initiator protein